MSRPTVQELDFPEFKSALDRAVAAGTRILPREKERWQRYVAAHKVRELNFQAYAGSKYDTLEPVIIDDTGAWGGYYMFSVTDEVAFRWQRATEDAAAT